MTIDKLHKLEYFLKHCEIVSLLANRPDREHPAVKHHIRSAIREVSNHVAIAPGSAKHSAQYISHSAQQAMEANQCNDLIAEHVVPVSILNIKVMELEHPTPESIAEIMLSYTMRAVITSEEDSKLKSLGFQKTMPNTNNMDNLCSRYDAAGISLTENNYSQLLKKCKA